MVCPCKARTRRREAGWSRVSGWGFVKSSKVYVSGVKKVSLIIFSMRELKRAGLMRKNCRMPRFLLILGLSTFINLVSGSAVWPSFSKRNVQALARDGLLSSRNSNALEYNEYKRSISTLAKNGQLPTFRAPEDNSEEQETEDSQKRNIASIARLKSYALKRNTGTLARNGVRAGKRAYDDKRNIGSLVRNGYIKNNQDKRENSIEGEYYYPFYQNPIPPVAELGFPLNFDELYDIQQSINPDFLPPLSEFYKRNVAALLRQDAYNMMPNHPDYRPLPTPNSNEEEFDQVDKRQSFGLPNHGLYRTIPPGSQIKRYMFSFPDIGNNPDQVEYDDIVEKTEKKSVDAMSEPHSINEKRHIGALARLGWLPSFRYSGSRYSRSGRARYFMPTIHYNYRKHSDDANLGAGEYISNSESVSEANPDDTDVSPAPVLADSLPAPRGGGRPVSRPLSDDELQTRISANADYRRFINAIARNRWEPEDTPKAQFYNFRSLKVPRNTKGSVSEKRYLLLPAVDNLMLRKTYPSNYSLPSRRKNQLQTV